DVGDGVGGGDTAEVGGIVDDRREEIGGGDQRLRVVQLVDRRVIRGFGADQQLLRQAPDRRGGEQFGQHGGGDLAAAAAAMAEIGEADFLRCVHAAIL